MYSSYLLIVANSEEGKSQLKDLIKTCKTDTNDFDIEAALAFFKNYGIKEEDIRPEEVIYRDMNQPYYGGISCTSILQSKILLEREDFSFIKLQTENSYPSYWIMKIALLYPELTFYLERRISHEDNVIEKFYKDKYLVKEELNVFSINNALPWALRENTYSSPYKTSIKKILLFEQIAIINEPIEIYLEVLKGKIKDDGDGWIKY